MNDLSGLVDLARSPDKTEGSRFPLPSTADYPPGLCIALSEIELEKLGLSDDVAVGDMLQIQGLAI